MLSKIQIIHQVVKLLRCILKKSIELQLKRLILKLFISCMNLITKGNLLLPYVYPGMAYKVSFIFSGVFTGGGG